MNDTDIEFEQCSRCGGAVEYVTCDRCGGEGVDGHECGEDTCACRYPEDNVPCDICLGDGGWVICTNRPEWCEAHPLPGRENVKRGEVETVRLVRGEGA